MAIRRPTSACLFCQFRQSLIGRRRLTTTARQRLETVALRPEDDGFRLNNNNRPDEKKQEPENDGPILPVEDTIRQWKLESPVDEIRDALLGFDALWKRRDLRLEVLRNLSNPWPDSPTKVPHNKGHVSKAHLYLPEANAAPIPHVAFRRKIRDAMSDKEIRKILRAQLLRCEWPREILRITAVAMQNRVTAHQLSVLAEPIIRALYRCRNNVSDPEVLRTLNTILTRFDMAGLRYDAALLQIGLRFAARVRSLSAMKKYLQLVRNSDVGLTSNVFRSVIAKFSIGHRGLGEIRNGRWRREQLLQVLKGFDDAKHLPWEQQYHMGTFLVREDWQYLHGWVAVLARCKDSEGVWHEWELWKKSAARMQPKTLRSQKNSMTSKKRGDYWFVEQVTLSGDLEKGWKVLAETGLPFHTLHGRVKTRLLDGVEYATVWDENVRNEMIKKYDLELSKIENALGVRWVATASGEDSVGTHEVVGDQAKALENLGADDFKLEEDYGFPYADEGALLADEERALHDAEESGLAQQDGDVEAGP